MAFSGIPRKEPVHFRNPLAITIAFIFSTAIVIALFYQKFPEPSSFFLAACGVLMITFSVLRLAAKFSS